MQALNFLAAAAVEEPPALDELGLLPHAAASVATATTAIVTVNTLRKGCSLSLFPVDPVAYWRLTGGTLPACLTLWAGPGTRITDS
jgi:hypothetical protein